MKWNYLRIGDIIQPGDQVLRPDAFLDTDGQPTYGPQWQESYAIGQKLIRFTPKTYRRKGKVRKYIR